MREMTDAGSELESLVDELRAETRRLTVEIEQLREEQQAEREAEAEDLRRAEEAVRRGEHGRAFQVLQQRVDLGQTTTADVLANRDDHWSAREVRAAVVGAVRESIDREEKADPAFSEAYRAIATLRPPDQGPGEWDPVEDAVDVTPPEPPRPDGPRPPSAGGVW